MKKHLLFLTALVTAVTLNAKVWTVSNNPDSPGQFEDLQVAIDTSIVTDGDTIYVLGSQVSYGEITINKSLTIFGSGHHPEKQMAMSSEISKVYFAFKTDGYGNIIADPSGSELSGFHVSGSGSINIEQNINNITIAKNYFSGTTFWGSGNLDGWLVINNIFAGSIQPGSWNETIAQSYTNWIVSNNIIGGSLSGFYSGSFLATNNLFIGSGDAFSNMQYATISNNILSGKSTSGCDYCSFYNNLSIGGSEVSFDYDNNSGSGNLENVNPMFVSVGSSTLSFDYNYKLSDASPCINAGSNGSDIGISGGSYPFDLEKEPPYQISPMVSIPVITEMNLVNGVLPEDGTLEIQMKARIQD